ncbi:hypothetical protein B0T26DRAFT_688409 [Lasiosphaeria miniovina]|uniref:Uncharacterized protein n=1 Tax=Lasiosphaeria miniovina TaxID=1954250 RepID=A0AA40BHP8_9PEZI|nr:uncharacterized protein B0T26DRAFT_688409 [Lasiosphaeria miniovina]KAK0734427.1 hypothetical protein B0T26DRAFT_688409 [Lasiosphaeria miniovina]
MRLAQPSSGLSVCGSHGKCRHEVWPHLPATRCLLPPFHCRACSVVLSRCVDR